VLRRDIDWEVRECPDKRKGLGIFALRDIPPLSRILVDRMFSFEEAINTSKLSDLHPKNGTQLEKLHLNANRNIAGESRIAFRYSRLNHSCNPNAVMSAVRGTNVLVVSSRRLILEGEEICVTYACFQTNIFVKINDPSKYLENIRNQIKTWGIICPSDCVCIDPTTLTLVQDIQRFYEETLKYGSIGDFGKALMEAKKLVQLFNSDHRLVGIPGLKRGLLFDAYQAAMASKNLGLEMEGQTYMDEVFQLISCIEYPDSEDLKYYKHISMKIKMEINMKKFKEAFKILYEEFFRTAV